MNNEVPSGDLMFSTIFLVFHAARRGGGMQPAKGASLSLRIQANQSLSRFSLIAQAQRKAKEKKRRFSGRCPEPRDVWSVSSKLMHKGSAFSRGAITKYLCSVAVQRKLCRHSAF